MTDPNTPYYVAFNQRFSHVRGRDTAERKLAEFMDVSIEELRQTPPSRRAGLIQRINKSQAAAAGI